MSISSALDDMRFVIREIADLPAIRSLPGWEEVSDDLVDAVLEEAGRFASEVLAPLNVIGDREGCAFENGVVRMPEGFVEAWQRFVEGGWNGLALPAEHGGQELPHVLSTAVGELWTAANMSFALCPMLTQAAAELLERHANARVKSEYLPKLVSGEWTGTMLLTEPQAGSDLGRVRAKARPEGDRWRISGQKIYITYGDHDMAPNIVHLVLARTPGAPDGVRGLSLFLVPKFLVNADGSLGHHNDVRCVSIEHKLGIRASPTAVIAFGDEDGAVGYLVGTEYRGLDVMFTMMNHARIAVGVEGVGMANRAYQQARAYAFERVQGRLLGAPGPEAVAIVHHPDVQRMLLTMKACSEGARALAYFAAAALDTSRHHPDPAVRAREQRQVDLLTPVVKAWCTDIGIDVANTAIQVHGGLGYIEESGVPQLLRDARIASIYEGTNGIQAMDLVGRKVAGDDGHAVRDLLAQIDSFGATALANDHVDIKVISQQLGEAAGELSDATDWLLTTYSREPRQVAAGAVFYLRLLGNVIAGWLLAMSARKAALGEDATGRREYAEAKRRCARCFADTRLSEAATLRRQFVSAGEALRDLDPEQQL